LLASGPKPGASTNFATRAELKIKAGGQGCLAIRKIKAGGQVTLTTRPNPVNRVF
jgi:hypothetical protein